MRNLYRGGLLLAGLVASLAIAASAAAAPKIPVNVATSAHSFTADLGCCIESTISHPFKVFVPRLGRLTAVADLDACVQDCDPDAPTIFSIQFTAPTGTFVLIGAADSSGRSGTWTVLDTGPFAPTGRFARIAGSGAWSAVATLLGPDVDESGMPGFDSILTLSLSGTLTLKA